MQVGMIRILLSKYAGHKFEKEFRFHEKRRWRFDYCHVETKTAVEVEGGVWTRGRHTRGKGFIGDMDKYNAAAELGYAVLRYTTDQMNKAETYEQIRRVIENRKL